MVGMCTPIGLGLRRLFHSSMIRRELDWHLLNERVLWFQPRRMSCTQGLTNKLAHIFNEYYGYNLSVKKIHSFLVVSCVILCAAAPSNHVYHVGHLNAK